MSFKEQKGIRPWRRIELKGNKTTTEKRRDRSGKKYEVYLETPSGRILAKFFIGKKNSSLGKNLARRLRGREDEREATWGDARRSGEVKILRQGRGKAKRSAFYLESGMQGVKKIAPPEARSCIGDREKTLRIGKKKRTVHAKHKTGESSHDLQWPKYYSFATIQNDKISEKKDRKGSIWENA